MTILVLGASGATGRLLVQQLLATEASVKIVVRPHSTVPREIIEHEKLSVIRADFLNLGDDEIANIVGGCSAIACCLGHNLNLQGVFGQPRRLVTDSVRRLCDAVTRNSPDTPVKFLLMNTAGNSHRGIPERVSFAQSCVITLLRLLLPPHVDNEQAADFLRTEIGSTNSRIEWVVVRPDTLTDQNEVTEYKIFPSPIRSAIFNAGTTSRINVGHFMAKLITDENTWNEWKGQMPVIYNG